jgi:hypothetical protein
VEEEILLTLSADFRVLEEVRKLWELWKIWSIKSSKLWSAIR